MTEPHKNTDPPKGRVGEVTAFTPEQLATPSPALTGFRQMWIIVGPYKGSVLTMPDAEAEAAKDDHWAVEMSTMAPPFDAANPPAHDHELTDEERAGAVTAANEWAAKVNAPPEPPPPTPPEGGGLQRTVPARGERDESPPVRKPADDDKRTRR
jgi:hypothetical protein